MREQVAHVLLYSVVVLVRSVHIVLSCCPALSLWGFFFLAPNNMLVFGRVTQHGVLPSRVKIFNIRRRCCLPLHPYILSACSYVSFADSSSVRNYAEHREV